MKTKFLALAAVAAAAFSTQAAALSFTFVNQAQGGAETGTQAYYGFRAAANYWSNVLTNNANVTIAIGFYSLGAGNEDVLGSAGSARSVRSISNYQTRVQNTQSGSAVDQLVQTNRPALSAAGGIDVITPGYVDPVNHLGAAPGTRVYDTDDSINNRFMYTTTANARAIGVNFAPGTIDAAIQFNRDFAFDFDPTDGIDSDKVDFTLVALHEIGHALGFVSGVDDYDYLAGNPLDDCDGQGTLCKDYDVENDYWGSALDMFRYGSNREELGGAGAKLDWAIRNPSNPASGYVDSTDNPYFSLDGGASKALGKDAYFSRGQYTGASYQASHWRISGAGNGAGNPTQQFLGIMDPVGRTGNTVTALDIAAFDAIGWNTNIDAVANPNYTFNTAQVYQLALAQVPEPAQWALMIGGFGLIGGAMRRRKAKVSVTFA